ncbi:MAG: AAA family ATPase [Butyrivibrio sp.]|uniref:AAA family ATPase n=1 Tax=Butyrivibrio sp. TaxID=28121 RepID=UPI0025F43777|nr:ATP-binding protein [Butyrivibrio sp.]MCR5770666.1 AAA family ATPase [Butyrivibrio sp.]
MLIQFTVNNYKSIKDTITLDLQAVSGVSEHKDHIIDRGDDELLPVAVIYGSNGSGKSNLLKAIELVKGIVLGRKDCKEAVPFYFSKESRNNPSKFEIIYASDSAEYRYRIHVKDGSIIYESLDRLRNDNYRRSSVFERKEDELTVRKILGLDDSKLEKTKEITGSDSFLGSLMHLFPENEIVSDAVNFFVKGLDLMQDERNADVLLTDALSQEDVWDLFRNMIAELDLDIVDLKVMGERIYVTHRIGDSEYEIMLDDESSGIRKTIYLLPVIANSLIKGQAVMLDSGMLELHPSVLKHILGYYLNRNSNQRKAQLILTSYDMVTLDKDFLRRDEIWFAARSDRQRTVLYSLADFVVQEDRLKDKKYAKRYLEGVYGADPFIRNVINWNEVFVEKENDETD